MAKSAKTKAKTKSLLTNKSLEFLRNYINNPSPVGFESSGQKIWLNYLKPYVDTSFSDPYGTAVGVINPKEPFKVVIEAHADEISWFVNYIHGRRIDLFKKKWWRGSSDCTRSTSDHSRQKRTCESSFWMAGYPYTFE